MGKFTGRRYAIDMDGTICEKRPDEEYQYATPRFDVIDKINELHDGGATIIVYTARGMGRTNGNVYRAEELFYKMTFDWLRRWNVRFDWLQFGKVSADYYVDDKCMSPDEFATQSL